MSSFVTGGAASASAPETETETTPKQLFVRMNGPSGQKLPPLQVLRVFFQKFGRVVKITPAKEGTIAFVTFLTSKEAQTAKNAMNDHEVVDESNGVNLVRTLFVDFAWEKGTRPDVQIFGNGIKWVIPHPDHPYATQDCERAYDSGNYFTQFPVKIPRDVLTSKKFWRD